MYQGFWWRLSIYDLPPLHYRPPGPGGIAAGLWADAEGEGMSAPIDPTLITLLEIKSTLGVVECPFCGEGAFDWIGLKGHFERGWCAVYNSVTISGL